jgi:hypothetical protein
MEYHSFIYVGTNVLIHFLLSEWTSYNAKRENTALEEDDDGFEDENLGELDFLELGEA